MQVRVTAQSQSHRLRERLEEAAVSHGGAVRADVRNVRVTALAGSTDGQAFFCNIVPIGLRDLITRGDGGPLPHATDLTGLDVPGAGLYDILNAYVSSNGALSVVVDGASQVVAAGKAETAPAVPAAW